MTKILTLFFQSGLLKGVFFEVSVMSTKPLIRSGTFFCPVCDCEMGSMLTIDTETGERWRACVSCDTRESNIQLEEVEDEQT